MKRRTALLAVTAAAGCFGTLAVFTSLAYERGAEPLQLLFLRFALATVCLAAYLLLTVPERLRIRRGDLGRFVVLSVAGYGAASVCFFFALEFVDASVAAILLYTYPAMVFLAEVVTSAGRVDPWRAIAVLLVIAGCALVVDPFTVSGGVHPLGVALGLGAAAGYASFTVLSHRWMPGRSRIVLMTYTFGVTAVLVGVIALVVGAPVAPVGWGWELWALLAGILVVPTLAAVILYLRALARIGAGQASVLSTFEPVFTIALAALVLGDRLSSWQLAGGLLVVGAAVLSELRARGSEAFAGT